MPVLCLFAIHNVNSFQEDLRIVTYSLLERVEDSKNMLVVSLNGSDVSVWSRLRAV